ncbi:SCAN domain-containing protein 3-like [Nerophis lumbriciformis]|uniref:SCAN domain-containing protein 3-like n=1 Tax=Nerophis lumbriciformis TaxID=546530 RepID=UPI002ADF21CD|nr:zinc finger protein 449-like [Nerophis lumbriciformis]
MPSRDSLPPDHHLRQGPKMLPFQQSEDIDNFLVRFERIARTWGWPQSDWACRLVPLLTGKALDAYSAMEEDASNVYTDLKEALLAKFDISPETYRLQFRSTYIPPGESPKETYNRLKGLYRRWIKLEQRSKEDIAELFILEQMLRMLLNEMKTWVKEHEPEDGLTAAKLAGQYVNARKGLRMPRQQNNRVAAQGSADLSHQSRWLQHLREQQTVPETESSEGSHLLPLPTARASSPSLPLETEDLV